jgi:hypothetical protein
MSEINFLVKLVAVLNRFCDHLPNLQIKLQSKGLLDSALNALFTRSHLIILETDDYPLQTLI